MSKNTPAFPVVVPAGYEYDEHHDCDGMALRDYFAAKAMQGDWAAQSVETGEYSNKADVSALVERASLFYRMADAMLEARK